MYFKFNSGYKLFHYWYLENKIYFNIVDIRKIIRAQIWAFLYNIFDFLWDLYTSLTIIRIKTSSFTFFFFNKNVWVKHKPLNPSCVNIPLSLWHYVASVFFPSFEHSWNDLGDKSFLPISNSDFDENTKVYVYHMAIYNGSK